MFSSYLTSIAVAFLSFSFTIFKTGMSGSLALLGSSWGVGTVGTMMLTGVIAQITSNTSLQWTNWRWSGCAWGSHENWPHCMGQCCQKCCFQCPVSLSLNFSGNAFAVLFHWWQWLRLPSRQSLLLLLDWGERLSGFFHIFAHVTLWWSKDEDEHDYGDCVPHLKKLYFVPWTWMMTMAARATKMTMHTHTGSVLISNFIQRIKVGNELCTPVILLTCWSNHQIILFK